MEIKGDKNILTRIIILLALCFYSNYCFSKNDLVKITNENFNQKNEPFYEVKFSNVFKIKNGKRIKIPIFNGSFGDVELEDLMKVQNIKDASILGNLNFFSKKGVVKKTLLEFLNFYKSSLLKDNDINKPTIIGAEGDSYIIWYDFVYEGINSSMMIHLAGDEKNMDELDKKRIKSKDRTIDMIKLNEQVNGFTVRINIGEESGFKK
jgi:hypothetical protein